MKNAGNVFSLNHFVEIRAEMSVKTETSEQLCEVANQKTASIFISQAQSITIKEVYYTHLYIFHVITTSNKTPLGD